MACSLAGGALVLSVGLSSAQMPSNAVCTTACAAEFANCLTDRLAAICARVVVAQRAKAVENGFAVGDLPDDLCPPRDQLRANLAGCPAAPTVGDGVPKSSE